MTAPPNTESERWREVQLSSVSRTEVAEGIPSAPGESANRLWRACRPGAGRVGTTPRGRLGGSPATAWIAMGRVSLVRASGGSGRWVSQRPCWSSPGLSTLNDRRKATVSGANPFNSLLLLPCLRILREALLREYMILQPNATRYGLLHK